MAEEAAEMLLPLAEKRGVTIETSGDMATTIGPPVLLQQLGGTVTLVPRAAGGLCVTVRPPAAPHAARVPGTYTTGKSK